jgi:hypothetical protein
MNIIKKINTTAFTSCLSICIYAFIQGKKLSDCLYAFLKSYILCILLFNANYYTILFIVKIIKNF